MPAASLAAVVEALDMQSDDVRSFLDPESGEIITFNQEEAQIAERNDWCVSAGLDERTTPENQAGP